MSERRSELKAVAGGDNMAAKAPNRDIGAITAQLMDGWSQVNTHLISLAQAPWRHTQAATDELRQCQSPKDLMEIQMRVARLTVDEYMTEARKLGDLMVKMSGDAMGYLHPPR